MDTSEKYVRMCRESKEIQHLWSFESGDYVFDPDCLLKHDYPLSDQEFVDYDPDKMISISLDIIEDCLFNEHVSNPANIIL
ncbi:hypothetical protein [Methanosarcina sp. 2.H.A.1B.4]|uniref:hypothetical protein n=1 Tax=Methanosarcina sp. 2.H.A.1B.4 TaxID=1483600 RepID=UPI00062190E4|nr:hypothetical protein [Methanosarcina sp. 2.H.A.1B.4]KKG13071.1 hypothetical protein EO92_07850 [Methanosarcina sp. 2.H.A.1B.4]